MGREGSVQHPQPSPKFKIMLGAIVSSHGNGFRIAPSYTVASIGVENNHAYIVT